MNDLISVITVCYNSEDYIEPTLKSIYNQSYRNIEVIIVDGGSTDSTVDIAKRYSNRYLYTNTIILSERDQGIYDAMNKGIHLASGNWIIFMNCGDTFVSLDILSRIFENKRYTSHILYGDTNYVYKRKTVLRKALSISLLSKHMVFCHQSVFVSNSLIKKNLFDLRFKIAADYNFFYNMNKASKSFEYLDLVVSNYEASDGLSSKQILNLQKEIANINGRNRDINWIIEYTILCIKEYVKKIIKYKNEQ